MLKVNDLTAAYGELRVVNNVAFAVREGEITALVGANGAGKSTIINAICGVLPRAVGSVEFLGQEISALKPYERVRLGLIQIPEGRHLFGAMTVMENLQLGAYIPEARKHLNSTLAFVFSLFPRLEERKSQIARTLSGGEQQMLAVGRGLMCKPRMLILDEPTWGLAPKLVANLLKTIQDINAEGITVLIVEQHIQQSLQIAHRAYVLENGNIVLEGTGKEVIRNEHVKQAYLGL